MELFKYQDYLLPSFVGFIIFVLIYLKLCNRAKKIFSSIFDPVIISEIIPPSLEKKRRIKDILLIISLFFILISLLGPQWGVEYKEKPSYLTSLAFVVDTSLSMSARDIKPSRLESVKLALKSIIENIKESRMAVIAFQDKAYIQCPLTDDSDAVMYFTDILKPDMLPYPGTNIADAILTTYEYLASYPGEKIVVLFTDGEDHSQRVSDAISKISKGKTKFITVGIGSPEGDILYDEQKNEPKKDSTGKTIISRLDEKTLIEIANATGGKYIRYTSAEYVATEIKKFIEKIGFSKNSQKTIYYKNRYQYFLIIAFLLILIEFIIMEIPSSLAVMIVVVLVSVSNLNSLDIKSEFIAEKANKYYNKKDYKKSLNEYQKALESDSQNEKIKFNMANTLYRLGRYDEAIKIYESIKNKKILSKSTYNTGNSYAVKNDIEKAEEMYRKAILYDISNEDAKYNLELLLKKKNSSSSSCSLSQKSDRNNDKNNKNKKEQGSEGDKKEDKKQQASQQKQQAEKFLDMIKNMERENIKKAAEKQKRAEEIKNEFDW